MIQQSDVHRLADHRELSRYCPIGGAGRCVARRVIMGQDQPGGSVAGGIREQLPERESGAAFITVVAAQVNASCLVVEVGNPQVLSRRVTFGKAAGEEALGRDEAVQSKR